MFEYAFTFMIKYAPIYGIRTNEQLKKLWINTFGVIFHYYQLHYKMPNNINTFEHVRKKKIVCRFHYPLLAMSTTKISYPF